MITVICLDDRGGALFNRRRQSMDRVLRARVLENVGNGTLWISPYTARQFTEQPEKLCVSDTPECAGAGEWAFLEDTLPRADVARMEKIVVYLWNRSYPSDVKWTVPDGFTLRSTVDFAGSSHEKITECIYVRAEQ